MGAPQYVRQMLTSMKEEINNNTIIVGDFNTPLTPMDRSTYVLKWFLFYAFILLIEWVVIIITTTK